MQGLPFIQLQLHKCQTVIETFSEKKDEIKITLRCLVLQLKQVEFVTFKRRNLVPKK